MARKKKSLKLSDAAVEVLKPALSWMRGAESSSTAEPDVNPLQGGAVTFPSTAEQMPTEDDLGVVAAEVHRLQAEIGDYILRLSACDCMALANTEETFAQYAGVDESHEAWSPAFASVRASVRRELDLRAANAALERNLRAAVTLLEDVRARATRQAEQHKRIRTHLKSRAR